MANVTISSKTDVRPLVPSNVVKALTAEALNLGEVVYRNSSGYWAKADASTLVTSRGQIGIVVAGGQASSDGTVASGDMAAVVVHGRVYLGGGLTLDETKSYYVSNTAGSLSDTVGTHSRIVGNAEDQQVFYVDPEVKVTSV